MTNKPATPNELRERIEEIVRRMDDADCTWGDVTSYLLDFKAALSPKPLDDAELEGNYQEALKFLEKMRRDFDEQSLNMFEGSSSWQYYGQVAHNMKNAVETLTALHAALECKEKEVEHLNNVIDYCSLQMSVSPKWLLEQIKEPK